MRHLLFFLMLLAGPSCFTGMAQQISGNDSPDKPLRIEIPVKSVNETYRIIPCGPRGMIMFFRSLEPADDSHVKWFVSLYDTTLQLMWTKSLPVLNDLDYRLHITCGDTLAMLFLHAGKPHGQENDFEILRVGLRKGLLILNSGKIQQDAEVVGFGIRKGRSWIGYNIKGQSGKLLTMQLSSGVERLLPLGQGSQIAIRWMQPDSASETVSAIVSRTVSKKTLEHFLVSYDTSGSIRHEVPVGTQDMNRDLVHVQLAETEPGGHLILGCYGQFLSGGGQKNRVTEASTGFISMNIFNGAQKCMNVYNFLELANANSLLDEHEILNLKKKALKKNKPINEYSLDFSLFFHDILPWNNQFVVTAEVYTPQYHTESFTDFDYYGRPYTNSFSVFDGYRFFNTIMAGFDKEGKLLWDNTFEIRNLVSMELSPKVVTFPSGGDLLVCYVSDGMIGTKIIHEGRVVEKPDFTQPELLYPNDKLVTETKGKILPWYGNYFLTTGFQEIKNIALSTNNKRLVFYFSKLRFEK